jgi:predicted ABC-type ATPase
MQQPHVIVFGGPNGAGKSTIAPLILRDYLAIPDFVNADQIAAGLSAFNPEGAAMEAGRIMLQRIQELADARRSFAFESTLSSRTFAVFLTKLKAAGYRVDVWYVWLDSVARAQERVALRVKMGGHAIPPEVVDRRYARSARNFLSMYMPIADHWRVYDNSEEGITRRIATGGAELPTQIFEEQIWKQIQTI